MLSISSSHWTVNKFETFFETRRQCHSPFYGGMLNFLAIGPIAHAVLDHSMSLWPLSHVAALFIIRTLAVCHNWTRLVAKHVELWNSRSVFDHCDASSAAFYFYALNCLLTPTKLNSHYHTLRAAAQLPFQPCCCIAA